MSLEKKIAAAATKAAMEAMLQERARMLWVMDTISEKLAQDVGKKLMIEHERHLAQVKLQIAKAVIQSLKISMLAGHRPNETSELNSYRKEAENGEIQ